MGSLLGAAFRTSEERTTLANSQSQPHGQIRWLDAAMDGLLTVEAERFMLSLPAGLELNCIAVLRPQIINELAELRRFRNRIVRRIDDLLKLEFRHGADGSLDSRLREELRRLKDWFAAQGASPVGIGGVAA